MLRCAASCPRPRRGHSSDSTASHCCYSCCDVFCEPGSTNSTVNAAAQASKSQPAVRGQSSRHLRTSQNHATWFNRNDNRIILCSADRRTLALTLALIMLLMRTRRCDRVTYYRPDDPSRVIHCRMSATHNCSWNTYIAQPENKLLQHDVSACVLARHNSRIVCRGLSIARRAVKRVWLSSTYL